MESQRIIMNFTVPPSLDDLEDLACHIMETMPDEIVSRCDDICIILEDMVDETVQNDLDMDDPFELLALYKSARQISPGVERKVANDDDVLVLYRRPILDLWCETEDDLQVLMRQIMIEELGRYFDFSDDDIEEMTERHCQGML